MTISRFDGTDPVVTGSALPPHPTLEHHYETDSNRPAFINGLFNTSARHYDRISWLMSFGTDRSYRRRVLLEAGLSDGMSMLDVACGTGMMSEPASDIVGPTGYVVGIDPSPGMLREAVRRHRLVRAVQGTAERLPLADSSFDMLCMGFALRHVSDLLITFEEYRRVVIPGGRVLVLEITPPPAGLSYRLFKVYLKSVVPKLTRISTFNRDAESLMSYFWDTVEQCVPAKIVIDAMKEAGFTEVTRHTKLGVFSEYSAIA